MPAKASDPSSRSSTRPTDTSAATSTAGGAAHMHEGHRQQPPPFAVRGARRDAAAPATSVAGSPNEPEPTSIRTKTTTLRPPGRRSRADGAYSSRSASRNGSGSARRRSASSLASKHIRALAEARAALFGAHGIDRVPDDHREGKDEHGTSDRRRLKTCARRGVISLGIRVVGGPACRRRFQLSQGSDESCNDGPAAQAPQWRSSICLTLSWNAATHASMPV